jgi:hypothetical protein
MLKGLSRRLGFEPLIKYAKKQTPQLFHKVCIMIGSLFTYIYSIKIQYKF